MGRPSKRVRKTRKAAEFSLDRLISAITPPTPLLNVYAWDLEKIRSARDEQMRGVFKLPAQLAVSMRTDDALFTAYDNRLDPQRNLGVELVAPNTSDKAKRVLNEAEGLFGPDGVGIRSSTLATINGDLANHGVAFAYNIATPRDDGSRIDFELRYWPIEWVRWDPLLRCFVTQLEQTPGVVRETSAYPGVRTGTEVPIIHGDGRWLIIAKHEHEPFKQEACVIPGSLLWGMRGFGLRDWAKGSKAHGNAKMFGELPEGVALQDAEGELTPEAKAFIELLQSMMGGDVLAGIRPAGSKTEFVSNTSTNWQVFTELVTNRDRAAARIYLGTDGTLGSPGGAPGVDVKALFGVATTKVQGDLTALERGILTGTIEPWAAINFGDSTLAPARRYMMPDADAEAVHANLASRLENFHTAIERLRKNGFEVKQDTVEALAVRFDVPVPMLPIETTKAPSITLAPTDLARVVSVNEARASAGLGPLVLPTGAKDPDGLLTVEEFAAKKAANAEAVVPPPAQAAPPGNPYRGRPAPTNGSA